MSVVILSFAMMGLCACGSGADEQEVLEKLEEFTTVYNSDDGDVYYFLDENEEWVITYMKENELVTFANDTIVESFSEFLGEDCFAEDSVSDTGFAYDLSEDEARIYFDVDVEDGHLTLVNYSFEDDEFMLMIDGERYEASEVFEEFAEEYKIVRAMKKDIDEFEEILEENGLSKEDLLVVDFDTLVEQYVLDSEEDVAKEPESEESEKTEEPEVIEKTEIIEVDYQYIYGGVMDMVLSEASEQIGGADWIAYTYYDMNNDGYLEFFVQTGTSNADIGWEVYSTDGDLTEYWGRISGNCTLYENAKGVGIYTYYGHMDYERITYIAVENGNLVEEIIPKEQHNKVKAGMVQIETRLLDESYGSRFYY